MKKKILIFTGYYLPGFKGGGPIRSISNLVDQLADHYDFSIISSDRDLGASSPYPSITQKKWNTLGRASVFYVTRGFDGAKDIAHVLRTEKYDAVSLNSFFSFQFSIIPIIFFKTLRNDCQLIISPRGEFSKGALGIKNLKKRIFIYTSKVLGLYKDIIWHASSDFEASDIRRIMGQQSNIRVAINISRPGEEMKFPIRLTNAPLRVIFISRISPMKNLSGAIDIFREVLRDVILDVYGPAEDESYLAECLATAKLLPKNIQFKYCGSLPPAEVSSKMSEYDLFLLPTLGENFGHVIAESFAAGLPVLISDATPWRNLVEKLLGWDIPLDQPEKFVAAVEECCSKTPAEYDAWRKHIRTWAVSNIGNREAIEQNRQLFTMIDNYV